MEDGKSEQAAAASAAEVAADHGSLQNNPPSSATNTLCEVALKISSAALMINQAALIIQDIPTQQEKRASLSFSSYIKTDERGTQTESELSEPSTGKC